MKYITKRIVSYCPEAERAQSIEVKFAEILTLGAAAPGYKAINYHCGYADEHGCSSNGSNGADCPLFNKAIQDMS